MGFFLPFSNSNGAFYGGLLSFTFSLFIYIQFYFFETNASKNVFNQNCSNLSFGNRKNKNMILDVTYEWYGLIAVLIVIFFGILISCLTSIYKILL